MSRARRWGIALAAVAACLALIGCGGGDRVNTLQMDIDELERLRDELTTAKTALERQVETEKTARQTVETELTTEKTARQTVETELTTEKTARQTAEMELATERTAKVKAETNAAVLTERVAQLAERLEEAETDLATAQRALDQAQTTGTTTSTELTEAKRQVTVLTTQVRELTEEVATLKVQLADANTKLAAAATTDDDGGHAGLFGDDDTTTTTTTTAPQTGTTGTTGTTSTTGADARRGLQIWEALELTNGTLAKETLADVAVTGSTVSISQVASGFAKKSAGGSSFGFRKATLTQTNARDGATETWVVYSNIERTRGRLAHYHAGDHGTINTVGSSKVLDFKVTATGFLASDATYTTSNGDVPLAELSVGVKPDSTESDDDGFRTQTISREVGRTVGGKIRGVGGNFVCVDADGCTFTATLMRDDTNRVTTTKLTNAINLAVGADDQWVFRTSDRQEAIPEGDEAHGQFGWWMSTPNSSTGDYMFEPRWGGTSNLVSAHPSIAATYKGLAMGWYARKTGNTITSDGESLEVITNGMFTADVTLWAAAAGTVDGRVVGFKEAGLSGWEVELKSNFDAVLKIGGTPYTAVTDVGDWGAKYEVSRLTTAADQPPVAAVGHFNAEAGDFVRLHGAFGATRQ